jgi:hypothetical protein
MLMRRESVANGRKIMNMPHPEYLDSPGASHSRLIQILRSPRYMREAPPMESDQMRLGTIVHALVLQPDMELVVVKPEDANRSSNANKEILLDWLCSVLKVFPPEVEGNTEGKRMTGQIAVLEEALKKAEIQVVRQDLMDKAQSMRDAVMEAEVKIGDEIYTGAELLSDGDAEVSIFAQDPDTGVQCKIRPDFLPDGRSIIIDLKTSQDASYEAFCRSVAAYGYHTQDALYGLVESWYWTTPRPRKPMLFVVVQSEPPYEVGFYELDQEARAAGEQKVRRGLEVWRRCEESRRWPGVGWDWEAGAYTLQRVTLPKWAL